GRADCSDTSDECPKELDKNVFSSRKELIGSAVFRATTWIFGLAAIVGNTGTFVYAAKTLSRFSSLNPITKLNYILLINLSVADGLMGVYLIALGSKGIEYSGNYCRFDKYWRTSSTCSNLGSLALVSSEATVLILAFLATLRLFSILNPLKTKRISIKIPIASIIVAWLLAIFVGVAPQFSSLSDHDNSVCLPKFFVSPGQQGWGYSVAIIVFNFVTFVYICGAYVVISRVTSSETNKRHRSSQLHKMQMRVTRLVLTDFVCWIPICIMSFLQLGGVEIPNQAYAFSAVILLPINSALNPLLYS
uniref:G-protein coupled receptors family 1 profile domain-containing protein n=1 Tax=Ciona savignyi TaxID=51511 RepID=H2ZG91_CIOSA